jgi:diguanylate cyclase (GGDEF)-like protein
LRHLRAFSVRNRLLALCLGLVMTFGSANVLLGVLINQADLNRARISEQYRRVEVIQTAEQLITSYRHTLGQQRDRSLVGDENAVASMDAAVMQAREAADQQLAKLAQFDAVSAERITQSLNAAYRLGAEAMRVYLQAGQQHAAPLLGEMQHHLDLIQETLAAAQKRERRALKEMESAERRRITVAKWTALIIVLGTGLLSVVAVLLVVRSILQPLKATTNAIRQVNAGLTDIDLPPDSKDEFGDVATALRHFRDRADSLRRLAYEDPLTGLGNRARLEEALQHAIARCQERSEQLAVLYIDIDNFRAVNDRWGHGAGDRYLCEAVARLHRFVPRDATLCRYAGDSFIVLLEGLTAGTCVEKGVKSVADCVLSGLSKAYPFGDHILNMSVSIGIAVYPGDGDTAEALVSGADAAMYAAKRNGRNNVRFASSDVTGVLRRQLAKASEIRRALEYGEFENFYQPVVDISSGRVVGAEALLRWRHPERGLTTPSDFIKTAEDSGLINALGEHCLATACRHLEYLCFGDGRRLRIAVNLSVHQVHAGKILETVAAIPYDPMRGLIELELTESVLFDAAEDGLEVLRRLKAMGFKLSMDDFGTGFSSLRNLQRLPVDKIKIDQQFVAEVGASPIATAIVSSIIRLAEDIGLEIVGEGVETSGQSRALRQLGCKVQQGYLFSPALPAQEFMSWAAAFERHISVELLNSGKADGSLIRR